jgi:endonuclease/exonuclease/phosphatase family metal-dependent hydrolase
MVGVNVEVCVNPGPGQSLRTSTLLVALAVLLGSSACATLSPVNVLEGPHLGDGQSLRVVSYNIGLGYMLETRDPRLLRLSRRDFSIRAALDRHPALSKFDVLGLQEVCSDDDTLVRLRQVQPDLHVYFARADPLNEGECRKGQAVLSRYPIIAGGTITLPNRLRVIGRSAIWVDIAVPGHEQPLRVYNVHFENRGPDSVRTEQAREVLAHVNTWRAEHPDNPVIVLGDFNSMGRRMTPHTKEHCISEMEARLHSVLPTYQATHVLDFQTDWIFFDALSLVRAKVVSIVRSDHYPLVADFVMGR